MMSSGANNGAKPLKSILKITRPKGAAGDTIDAVGAGKTKKDGMGIQPFKVRRKVSIAPDGIERVFTYVETECSNHVGVKEPKMINGNSSNMATKTTADANDDPSHVPSKKLNFRSFVNEEKVENSDIVLPWDAIDKVKNKYDNLLVGYFIGKSLAFPIFADKRGMEQVLEQGPWLIFSTPLILNKWTPSLPLRKDEVTKVHVWVKLHKVPLVAYSEDGLSLIATQIGKPLMLDAFTSTMCVEAWGRISFARALVEISSDSD
ncbi:nucleotide-binding alpha-beta plait domain-containing protein [Tanacetum coccineum]